MIEGKKPPSLKDLDARLRQARSKEGRVIGREPADAKYGAQPSGIGLAARLGVEMVAGVAIGVGTGLLLDRWLGTQPWLMLLFLILGFGAGGLSVYRTATGVSLAAGYGEGPEEEDDS